MPRKREIQFGAKTLGDFLKENLYQSEFETPILSDLGWTKAALTWAANSPETLSFKKVKQLARFLFNDETRALMLLEYFGAGKNNITEGDKESLRTAKTTSQP